MAWLNPINREIPASEDSLFWQSLLRMARLSLFRALNVARCRKLLHQSTAGLFVRRTVCFPGFEVRSHSVHFWRESWQEQIWASVRVREGNGQTENTASCSKASTRQCNWIVTFCCLQTTDSHVVTLASNLTNIHESWRVSQEAADVIIGADTVVTMDGQVYEKPKDKEDAFNMLSRWGTSESTTLLESQSGVKSIEFCFKRTWNWTDAKVVFQMKNIDKHFKVFIGNTHLSCQNIIHLASSPSFNLSGNQTERWFAVPFWCVVSAHISIAQVQWQKSHSVYWGRDSDAEKRYGSFQVVFVRRQNEAKLCYSSCSCFTQFPPKLSKTICFPPSPEGHWDTFLSFWTGAEGFNIVDFHEGTEVAFADISPETIRAYIDTGEPM